MEDWSWAELTSLSSLSLLQMLLWPGDVEANFSCQLNANLIYIENQGASVFLLPWVDAVIGS